MEGARARRRDQLRGIHARAMGLIAIRYPTGRSACQQFACSLLPRRNDWVCKHNGEQECHTSPPNPNSDRDRQGPLCTGQPLLLLSHAKQDDISTEGVTGFHYLHTPQTTKLKKSQDLDSPAPLIPGFYRVSCPSGPDPWTDSCSPLSFGATGAHPRISQSANLSLTASTNQLPLPTISDTAATDGLAGKILYLMHAPLQSKCCSSLHETDATVGKRAAG